jgi:hypothetical protein
VNTSRVQPLESTPASAAISLKVLDKLGLTAVSAAFLESNPKDMNRVVSSRGELINLERRGRGGEGGKEKVTERYLNLDREVVLKWNITQAHAALVRTKSFA